MCLRTGSPSWQLSQGLQLFADLYSREGAMLGFSSAAFYPRPRPTQDLSAEPRKPRLPKDATSRRFLVRRQGYLRNSRRIFEIGSQAAVVLDLTLSVRSRVELSDVMAVKLGTHPQKCSR